MCVVLVLPELPPNPVLLVTQAKQSLEKAKQSLEGENVDMANEIKQLSAARQEADRRRKQAENQLQEYTVRLTETDRSKSDLTEKANKLQVSNVQR